MRRTMKEAANDLNADTSFQITSEPLKYQQDTHISAHTLISIHLPIKWTNLEQLGLSQLLKPLAPEILVMGR